MPDRVDPGRQQRDVVERVIADLRRPVSFDPRVDAGALRRIQVGDGRHVGRAGLRRWLVGAAAAACAAAAAGLLLSGGLGRHAGGRRMVASFSEPRAVQLRLVTTASSAVTVAGDFNDWDPQATPLRPTGRSGEWTVELRLRPGRYRYAFLVDGRNWVGDPSEPRAADSDYGAPTSVLTVS
jgi:hypothetical protein